MPSRLRVRLVKSPISYTARTRGTVRALGLHRMNEIVEIPDNPATRGMVRAVRFLVDVETVGSPSRARASAAKHGPASARPSSAEAGTSAGEAPRTVAEGGEERP